MASDILVFVERRVGEIKRPSLEALGAAADLAATTGGTIVAVALGPGASGCAADVGAHGATKLIACDADHLELYSPEVYAATLAEAIRTRGVGIVLLAATAMGRDLAPRVAAKLDTGLISDAVTLEATPDGGLRGRRPVFSGKAIATVAIPVARPAMATTRPNTWTVPTASDAVAEVETMDAALAADQIGAGAVRLETPEQQELDVAEASIIVSGGRGIKAPENFALIRDLANELGAAVGASRAVVDAGWIGHAHQVGQTGKVVSPNLYVACGISGAIQHLAGMSSSKLIVAINKDPEAPIFKVADYGIVADLFEVVPKLTEALRAVRA